VNVMSIAAHGSVVSLWCCVGSGRRNKPMSAGRNVGRLGRRCGGSSWMSVCVRTRLARGPSLVRMWNKVSRI
jgi:hypothetical protein